MKQINLNTIIQKESLVFVLKVAVVNIFWKNIGGKAHFLGKLQAFRLQVFQKRIPPVVSVKNMSTSESSRSQVIDNNGDCEGKLAFFSNYIG